MMKKFIATEGEDHHEREGKMLSKPQRDFHSKLEIEHCLVEENIFLTLLFCYI